MPARRIRRPGPRSQLLTGTQLTTDPDAGARLLSDLSSAHQELERRVEPRAIFAVDLPVGATRINHKLGRKARHVAIGPTTADATWAWAWANDGDATVVITTVGVPQTAASVEVT